MTPEELRDLVERFLAFILETEPSESDEATLEMYLDTLAYARHGIAVDFDETDYPDPPEHQSDSELYSALCQRFPRFGNYNEVLNVTTQVGEPEYGVGDAIDDLADIVRDLRKVQWCWEHTSDADALWHYCWGFDHHWGRQHLRNLLRYLYELWTEG